MKASLSSPPGFFFSTRRGVARTLILMIVAGGLHGPTVRALDANGNGLNDVWELIYGASGLPAGADTDGDGTTNGQESTAGTNPFDANSRPGLSIAPWSAAQFSLGYARIAGKRYRIESKTDLGLATWTAEYTEVAPGADAVTYLFNKPPVTKFWRLAIDDVDTDGDGLMDAEERWLGFDPATDHTDRNETTDLSRATAGLSAANVVTLGVLDARMTERWPDPGVLVVRRSGGLKPITVNVAFTGSATRNVDYTASVAGNVITFPLGVREVPIVLEPIADADDAEPAETIIVTIQAGPGYTPGAATTGTVNLENETAASLPSAKAAARFLLQAAFGPDQAPPSNPDTTPPNVTQVMALGYGAWIDDQFTRPIGFIQPYVDWAAVNADALQLYGNSKEHSWWGRAMGAPKLRPDDAGTVQPDPLRQRIAFALSEILVASDRPEALAVEPRGMANFYDLFEQHAFGNYRDLLQAVARHPVMGIYLSHLGNQKANPATHVYPDENFAREIMQLFSIGLWELNPNGTRQLDGVGQPIPTYNNGDITELARVFTGLSFGNNVNFDLYPRDFTVPMKGWDAYHDLASKTLLGGLVLPARTASPGNTGTATMADVTAAVDHLFNHQNVGPFVAYRLIQRLIVSNPSPAYVGRVAAAFADNGAGVRGDLKAVVKAILLDPEARDPAMMSLPAWGKLREPFLRCVNFARAFNASSVAGYYPLDQFAIAHFQDPMNSPSVFNFFLPTHSPSGPITQQGLVAPEFQIINASTAVSGANYFWNHTLSDLHYWGTANPNYGVRLNLNDELIYVVPLANIGQDVPSGNLAIDPDPLLRRLDLVLTGGTLSPQNFQIIREAMLRIPTSSWQWHRERLRMAIYLITTSSDFNVLR
jgi:uncharacterized protein (DUF1800 family)